MDSSQAHHYVQQKYAGWVKRNQLVPSGGLCYDVQLSQGWIRASYSAYRQMDLWVLSFPGKQPFICGWKPSTIITFPSEISQWDTTVNRELKNAICDSVSRNLFKPVKWDAASCFAKQLTKMPSRKRQRYSPFIGSVRRGKLSAEMANFLINYTELDKATVKILQKQGLTVTKTTQLNRRLSLINVQEKLK